MGIGNERGRKGIVRLSASLRCGRERGMMKV